MPHLRTDTAASRLIDTPATNNFIMRNPFMIFRLVMLGMFMQSTRRLPEN